MPIKAIFFTVLAHSSRFKNFQKITPFIGVSCGQDILRETKKALSCGECGEGHDLCHGECHWMEKSKSCVPVSLACMFYIDYVILHLKYICINVFYSC